MKKQIIPAIIAGTQVELDSMLEKVKGRMERVMLDVMDGKFVVNNSLDFDFSLPSGFTYEAHLMVTNPLEWVLDHGHKVDWATLHIESLNNVRTSIKFVKKRGLKVNLALNPEIEIESTIPFLSQVDGILVMTVDPGRYGGKFLPETLKKALKLRNIDKEINIGVDGGMSPTNVRLANEHGANIFASGSYILKSIDVDKAIRELREAIS